MIQKEDDCVGRDMHN